MSADRSSRPWSVGRSILVLLAVVLLLGVALGTLNGAEHGPLGVAAAVTAVSICGAASLLALVATAQLQHAGAVGPLAGIGLRTGIPLAALWLVPLCSPRLAEARVAWMIMASYLAVLVAETVLVVGLIQPRQPAPSAASSDSQPTT